MTPLVWEGPWPLSSDEGDDETTICGVDPAVLDQVVAAAKENVRSITNEIEFRLRESFVPRPPVPRELDRVKVMLTFLSVWESGGMRALLTTALDIGEPDETEWLKRWYSARAELDRRRPHPDAPQSGFIP